MSQWNGSWPIQLKPNSPKSEVELPELCSDADYVANLRNKLYMASVSPWFFTVSDVPGSLFVLWVVMYARDVALWEGHLE